MSKINELKNYILENDIKLNITTKTLNILNYKEILHFDNNTILINTKEKILKITGEKLIITNLLKEELIITGIISKIEFDNHE